MSTMSLTLPLTPLLNRYYRKYRNMMMLSGEATAYKQQVAVICQMHLEHPPFTGDVRIVAHVYRLRRAGDIDGYAKGLMDSLQGHAYIDDKQVTDLHMIRHDDKKNPRVELTIEEC